MMTRLLLGLVLIAVSALPASAGDSNFEQKKAEILARIDQKIAQKQQEKACIQAATSHNDLKVCREQFRGSNNDHRQNAEGKR